MFDVNFLRVMKDLLKKAAYVLLWSWQLPQNIAGLAVWMYYERKAHGKSCRQLIRGVSYLRTSSIGSGKALALGEYVVLNWFAGHDTVDHEFGHVRQSRMLGPLYLPLIGLQSLSHAAVHYDLCGKKKYKPYTHFWTERWADRLGGVRR